jgi:hypothetical protein
MKEQIAAKVDELIARSYKLIVASEELLIMNEQVAAKSDEAINRSHKLIAAKEQLSNISEQISAKSDTPEKLITLSEKLIAESEQLIIIAEQLITISLYIKETNTKLKIGPRKSKASCRLRLKDRRNWQKKYYAARTWMSMLHP